MENYEKFIAEIDEIVSRIKLHRTLAVSKIAGE